MISYATVKEDKEILDIIPWLPKQLEEISIGAKTLSIDKLVEGLFYAKVRGTIILARDGCRIVGIMALVPEEYWYSEEWYYKDLAYFVDKDYRKSKIAVELLNKGITFCKENNRPFFMELYSTEDISRKSKYFERKGFTNVGGMFVWQRE